MRDVAMIVGAVFAIGAAAYHLLQCLMVACGWIEVRRQRAVPRGVARAAALRSGRLPGVSVVVPAFNEELSIVQTVRSVLASRYPDFEIIVVSDGSVDATMRALRTSFRLQPDRDSHQGAIATQNVRAVYRSALHPRIRVIDKRNGGKADALNAGINYADRPLVLAIDADVVLDPTALLDLAIPFASDATVVATTGTLRPQNGCSVGPDGEIVPGFPSATIERLQVLEYLRAYSWGRYLFDRFNAHLIISGALGLFRRETVISVGGYQVHAIGEDMELVVRLHRHLRDRGQPYRIAFVADALALTQAPYSLAELGRQRTRWHQGLLTTLRVHRKMLLNRRYGAAGFLAMPYFMVELCAPVVEALGWLLLPILWVTGLLSHEAALSMIGLTVFFGTAVSLLAILLDSVAFKFHEALSTRLSLAGLAVLEHLGYRQLTVYFRVRALFRYYSRIHLGSVWRSPARLSQPGRAPR